MNEQGMTDAARQELMTAAEDGARNYFKQGLNCAESVLKTMLDLKLIDYPPEIVALSTVFGGGIAHTRNACGAVLGACMAISAAHGRKNPLEKETLQERVQELYGEEGLYAFFQRFLKEVEEEYGTIICSEMSEGYDWESKPRKRNCMGITTTCAGLAVKYILEPR